MYKHPAPFPRVSPLYGKQRTRQMEAINKNNLLESFRESRKDFHPKIMKYWRQAGSLKRRYCLGGARSVNDFRGRDRNLLWRLITGCVESVSWLGFVGNSLAQRASVDVIHVLREIMGTQLNSTWSLIISHVCLLGFRALLLISAKRKAKTKFRDALEIFPLLMS